MLLTNAPFWKEAPFIRQLLPLMAGILLQWYRPFSPNIIIYGLAFVISIFLTSLFLKGVWLYRFKWIAGVCIMLMVMLLAMLLTHYKNVQHQQTWFGNYYSDSSKLMVRLREPPVEKNKSYKVEAEVVTVMNRRGTFTTKGKLILYFKKDSGRAQQLHSGMLLLLHKKLQPITNSGNPGAFDYQRYCLFQGITHQVFLSENDFAYTGLQRQTTWHKYLQQVQQAILVTIKKYIPQKEHYGIAEALLIGYREDMDRDLVQQYANTGVIHVIAISGMHLAMIYGLLLLLLKPLGEGRRNRILRSVIILSVLWGFSFLSGGGASILRSAVMFSFIVIGQNISRSISVYHSLAASAFFLLCNNPFLLWDVGFQLSYAAVLSIVIFLKPVTNWVYFKNTIAYNIWKLAAVTIAAQILTTPLSMYHFHQVPNLFLISNLFIVPLSGVILYGEIAMCLLSFIPLLASWLGKALSFLIGIMNGFNGWLSRMPFAVSNGINLGIAEVWIMYLLVITVAVWLLQKRAGMLKWAVMVGLLLVCTMVYKQYVRSGRTGIIVYNVPQHSAVDLFSGGKYHFIGDTALLKNDFLRNFHLQPARIALSLKQSDSLTQYWYQHPFVLFNNKRILVPGPGTNFNALDQPVDVDIIILSGRVKSSVTLIQQSFRAKQYVFDGSCPRWKMQRWKNECDSLHLRRHSVQDDGAFELDL